MDFDISSTLGIRAKFDSNSLIIRASENVVGEYWEKFIEDNRKQQGVWRSFRIASNYSEEIEKFKGDFSEFWGIGRAVYSGKRRYYLNEGLLRLIDERKIRPDITIIPFGVIGEEFNRTEGHEHLSKLPEIYSVVLGRAGFLLFNFENEGCKIRDAKLVIAEEGENVLFPSGYAHITINLGRILAGLRLPLIVTDFVSVNANPDFKRIKKMNGGPYWIEFGSEGEVVQEVNSKYEKIPELQVVRPASEIKFASGFVLRKGEPLFGVPKKEGGIEALDFLNDSNQEKHREMYENAFVRADE